MDRSAVETKLKSILAMLFNVDPATITAESSPDTIEAWDSLQHLNIVTEVEQAFDITLDEEQVVEMLSFGLIVEIVMESVGKAGQR